MSLSKHYPIAKIKAVIFTRWKDKKQIQQHISSKLNAQVLLSLYQADKDGMNKADLNLKHSFELSSAIYELRNRYHLDISTIPLKTTRPMLSYVLQTPIQIDEVSIEGGVS